MELIFSLYKKILLLFFFFIWMFRPFHSFASTWASDSIEATVGYGNYINLGRYTPVTVTIKNGYAAFGGTVELHVPTNTDDYYSYQKPYPSSPGTVQLTFCIPLSNSNNRISVLVDNHLDPPQQITLNYFFPLEEEDNPIFFGILSNNGNPFTYLNQINLSNYQLDSYSYALSPEEIAGNFRYLDNFDCIIIDNFTFSSLYESQLKILKDWVYHGGIILIGNEVEQSDLLLPSSISESTYTPIAELSEEHKKVGLEHYSYGSGKFVFSNFSLSAIENTIINDQTLQDSFIEFLFGSNLLRNLENPYYSQFGSLQNEASALTSQVQARTNVNIFLYGFILVIYLFILLPIIYYQLKKRDLIQYFRYALPIISITVAGIIFLLGSKTRFSHPFLTYVSIQEYDEESVKESIFTGIQAPYNRSYSVSIDNSYQLIPMQTPPFPYASANNSPLSSNHQITIRHQENDYLLTFENLVAFNMRNFELEKTTFLFQKEGIFGNVQYYDNAVSGVLTNRLGFDLHYAMLALPGYFVHIGNFAKDASVILENCSTQMNISTKYQPSNPNILSPIVYPPSSSSSPSADMKLNLLDYYLKQCDVSGKDTAYLIGFNSAVPNFQADTDYSVNGLTLVSIPVSLSMSNHEQTYYPSLPAKAYQISGDFSEDGYEIYSHFATVRYDISKDTVLDNLDLFFLKTIGSDSYPYVSKVYFWRKDELEYEQVYPGKTSFTKEELRKYITSENSLLVQYYTENSSAYLPRMTATGGTIHVNH